MADDFIFADSPGYVWADLPDSEWAGNAPVANVVRLCRPRLVNLTTHYRCKSISTRYLCRAISTHYQCKSIKGGKVMANSVETIRIGHGGTVLLQLEAENMETGVTAPLPEAVMTTISRVKLVLASGVLIDSAASGVGLGAGLPFDHTVDPAEGKLALTLGGLPGLADNEGYYENVHLDIYYGSTAWPIEFAMPGIRVLAAE